MSCWEKGLSLNIKAAGKQTGAGFSFHLDRVKSHAVHNVSDVSDVTVNSTCNAGSRNLESCLQEKDSESHHKMLEPAKWNWKWQKFDSNCRIPAKNNQDR